MKVIVNHCPDGTSVFLVALQAGGKDSEANWAAYIVPRKRFEDARRLLIKERKLPLILDLDYTLVLHRLSENGPLSSGGSRKGDILPRAGLAEFLATVEPLFQLHVFTQAAEHLASEYVSFLNDVHRKASGSSAAIIIAGK